MWTHALQINWMESLAAVFLCMMVVAGAAELWQRQSGRRGRSTNTGQSKPRPRRRKVAIA